MRILNVNKFHHLRGGTERYYFGIAELLRARGHEVRFFSMTHHRNLPDPHDGGFVPQLDYETLGGQIRAPARVVWSIEARRRMEEAIEAFRPDLALLHNLHYQLTLSVLAPLRRRRIPTVWRLHDYQILCPNGLFYTRGRVCEACAGGAFHHAFLGRCQRGRRLLSLGAAVAGYVNRRLAPERFVDLFSSPSGFLRRKMIEHGLPPDRISVVPNFVEATPLPPPSRDDDVAGAKRPFLFSGRLSLGKGAKTVVRALAHAPGARLVVAGEGPERDEVAAVAASHAPGRVELAGHVEGEALWDLVRGSAAVVVPSEWYENCPYAVLEALARARPVIGAAIGGIPELVEDGVNGILFPSGDEKALGRAMLRILGDPEEARRMGERGRVRIERDYGPETHYERLMASLALLPPRR